MPGHAVVGAGAFGSNHCRVVRESQRAELTAVVDLDPARGTLTDYRKWAAANEPTVEAPGGGESRAATVQRYAAGYQRILAQPEQTILVVAHGLPIRYVLNALERLSPMPLVEQATYAEPYRLSTAELEAAVRLLEAWVKRPNWNS